MPWAPSAIRRAAGLAGCALTLSCPHAVAPRADAPLTRLGKVREFARDLRVPRPVDVSGVVTYFDPSPGIVYLQDAAGAAGFEVGDLGRPLPPGTTVRLAGILEEGSGLPRVRRPRLEVLSPAGEERLPEPLPLTMDALLSRQAEARWVELRGVVVGSLNRGRYRFFDLHAGGRTVRASLPNRDQSRYSWLTDSRISIRGVSAAGGQAHAGGEPAHLLVPDMAHLRLEEEAPGDPFGLPLLSVAPLSGMPAARLPDHRVHVRGVVARCVGEHDFVMRADGREFPVTVASREPAPVRPGDDVEVVGFASATAGGLAFGGALVRARGAGAAGREPGPSSLPVLTSADEVRHLGPSEAQRGYPVRLRAVVTYNDPRTRRLFVQDATAGIFLSGGGGAQAVAAGDRVRVEGHSAPGAFAPIVEWPRLTVLGHGPLPPARRIRPEELVTGHLDSQWVEVEGVVRSVSLRRDGVVVRVASGGIDVPVEMPRVAAAVLADRLVNARVRVRGACRSVLTARGQLADIVLASPGPEAITVVTPAPTFTLPTRPIQRLLHFMPEETWEHRVRVRGVVTYSQPGEFYVQDDGGGLYVHHVGAERPAVGEEVEAVGFAARGEYSPALQDAEVRRVGPGRPPRALDVTPDEAWSGRFDSELVRLEARLLDSVEGREERLLSLQAGPYLFTAVLRGEEPWPEGLRAGSVLRLVGVCAVSTREQRVPQAFRILLRTGTDVEVVQPAPWWTSRRAAWVLSAMAGLVTLALAWVVTLRRRVQAQARIIWKRVRRETELQERQRMARELHDTLEQNLAGISLCLEAARLTVTSAPAMAENHVARALVQVEASIDEVHRAVWALREESLETHGLHACLDEIGRQLAACHPAAIDLTTSVEGAPRPFPVAVENNLLRIGQEALTNAVRHGEASRIEVRLRYGTDSFSLRVSDDGHGFDVAAAAAPGHFGLAGMRERVQEMGGRLEVASAVNRGTEVAVTLPLEPLALRETG